MRNFKRHMFQRKVVGIEVELRELATLAIMSFSEAYPTTSNPITQPSGKIADSATCPFAIQGARIELSDCQPAAESAPPPQLSDD